ncbi:MAG TPA: hypothetical protein VMH86_11240 [Rhizomicrobium sp.]|nr:hypothetical protein [Rhizomicrobium sp.]
MDIQHMLYSIWDFFRAGFQQVNAVEGLVIALVAALLLPAWSRLWAVALGATLANLVIDVLIPVVSYHRSFRLPPDLLELPYWEHALILFVGYLVVIAVFFAVKRRLTGGGH